MDTTANLHLPYIAAAQAQKHVTHNEALRALDAVVHLAVLDKDLTAPPAAPPEGARYIVAASPTGAWAGQAGRIAAFQDGAWAFYAPGEGWLAWVADEGRLYVLSAASWTEFADGGTPALNPVPLVGINTTADATTRLAVASAASLLTHAGAGHQAKINKAAAADTASLLFQTGFSGRAEVGTTGDDNLHVKVSADGLAWREALVIDAGTGAVAMPATPRRERLAANRTYFVRTDGNDANDGLSNTPGGAFATLQKALNVAATIDFYGFTVAIQLGSGTYSTFVNVPIMVGQSGFDKLVIESMSGNPSDVTLTQPGGFITLQCLRDVAVFVRNLTVLAPSGYGFYVTGHLRYSNINFGACDQAHVFVDGGFVEVQGNYSITGDSQFHWIVGGGGGFLKCQNRTITAIGTRNFSATFVLGTEGSLVTANGNIFVGTYTGVRYSATLNGIIQTFGGGPNALPGSVAGTTATGGQYGG